MKVLTVLLTHARGGERGDDHRVDRVLSFFSSRRSWDYTNPPPLVGGGGGTRALAGEGMGGPNSDEGTDTMVL